MYGWGSYSRYHLSTHSSLYLVKSRCFRFDEPYQQLIKEDAVKLIDVLQAYSGEFKGLLHPDWNNCFSLFKVIVSKATRLEEVEYSVIDCILETHKRNKALNLAGEVSFVKKNGDCMDFRLYKEKVVIPAIAAYNRGYK